MQHLENYEKTTQSIEGVTKK